MAAYIERSAAIEAAKHAWAKGLEPSQYIEALPAADVAPVVRCGYCKHIRPEVDAYTGETVGYWCAELDIGSIDVDDFCSHGERKVVDNA